jgi:hypothetical protein
MVRERASIRVPEREGFNRYERHGFAIRVP